MFVSEQKDRTKQTRHRQLWRCRNKERLPEDVHLQLQVDIVSDSSRNLSFLTPSMKCVFVSEQKDKTTQTLHSGVMEERLREKSLTMSSVH